MVLYHDREEIEEFAAALEALTALLFNPEVRAGDRHRARIDAALKNLQGFARELIDAADDPDDDERPALTTLALNRDELRYLCYGVVHTFSVILDAKEETVDGEFPQERLAALCGGFWFLTGRWETERRAEVFQRLETRGQQAEQHERQERAFRNLLGDLPLPAGWADTEEPVPEE